MDNQEFRRLMDVPGNDLATVRSLFLQIETERKALLEQLATQETNSAFMAPDPFSLAIARTAIINQNVSSLALQYIYFKETGRPLDSREAEKPGDPPEG